MDIKAAQGELDKVQRAYLQGPSLLRIQLAPVVDPLFNLLQLLIDAERDRQQREEKNAN